MFVDASALLAILVDEAEATEFRARIKAAPVVLVSPIAIYETVLAVARVQAVDLVVAEATVGDFLDTAGAQIIPIDAAIGTLALDAFTRYGKGRHPAALNMGDCFAYACAKASGVPLLAKGSDFRQTDVTLA